MNTSATNLCTKLRLKYPLIVAPMAGGPSSPELVIASCEAGALGSIGAAYLNAAGIEDFVLKVRAKTQNPFAINLFLPSGVSEVSENELSRAVERTQKFRDELRLPTPILKPPYEEDFDKQFEMVLKLKPAVLSFVFGTLSRGYLTAAHQAGIFTIGTATTVNEAQASEESGVNAIVLQGVEGGGHRGIFDANAEDPNIPLMELLKESKKRVKVPLIAAGGIMNKEDVVTVLQAGADAVQMGTAFLATEEAGTSAPYRKKLLETDERKTKLTRAFSGRLARGIENRFMNEMDSDVILPFQAQNKFTRDIRNASVAAGSSDYLSLWCGTGRGMLWTGPAGDLITQLFAE